MFQLVNVAISSLTAIKQLSENNFLSITWGNGLLLINTLLIIFISSDVKVRSIKKHPFLNLKAITEEVF